MINSKDIQIDIYTPGCGPVTMRLTHWPTSTVVKGKGYFAFLLREPLLKELEEQLAKGETDVS